MAPRLRLLTAFAPLPRPRTPGLAAAVVAGIGLAAELGAWSTGVELSRDRILEIATAAITLIGDLRAQLEDA